MSSITKLSLSGIRSYDNRKRETITFNKPLTLIAGPNGVGKTTIIEALRYVTTGDLPPNSKGGAFIHDPKMSGENQVLGQVKLGYISANGQHMVVTRSMQLTMKKTTSTFKTLEGQLLLEHDGHRETLSSRCADLDIQVPLSLGVSTAVLNYVIFCHQEDSMWPLSEPSIVKRRFDDIFEATKYSKALDAMKTLRKDFMSDIKLQEQKVQYMSLDYERAIGMGQKIDEITQTIQDRVTVNEGLQTVIDKTVKELDTLFQRNQEFQKIVSELNQARSTRVDLQAHIRDVSAELETLDEPDDVLESKLQAFDGGEDELRALGQSFEQQKSEAILHLEKCRKELSALDHKRGMLEAEKNSNERRKSNLQRLTDELSDKYERNFSNVSEELAARLAELKEELRTHQAESSKELEKLQAAYDQAQAQRISSIQQLKNANDGLAQNTDAVQRLDEELTKLAAENSHGNPKYQKVLLEELRQNLNRAESKLDEFDPKAKVQHAQDTVVSLQQTADEIQKELIKVSSRASERSKINVLKDNIRKKQFYLEDMKEALQNDLSGVCTLENFESTTQELSNDKEKLVGQRESIGLKYEDLKTQVRLLTEEQKALTLEMETLSSLLKDAKTDPKSFGSDLRDAEESLEVATQELEQMSFITDFYQKAKSTAHDKSLCLLCHHQFSSEELEQFMKLMAVKITKLPFSREESQIALDDAKGKAESFRRLAPQAARFASLEEKLPQIAKALNSITALEAAEAKSLEQINTSIQNVSEKQSHLHTLRTRVYDYTHLSSDISNDEKELESSLNYTVDREETSPQELQEKLSGTNQDLKNAQNALEMIKEKVQMLKDDVTEARGAVSKKELELKDIEILGQRVQSKKQQIEELRRTREAEEKKLSELQRHIESVMIELDAADEALKEAKLRTSQTEHGLSAQVSAMERDISNIEQITSEISRFSESFGENPLGDLDNEIDAEKTKISEIEEKLQSLESEINVNERKVYNFRNEKRVLQDNLQLRRYESQLRSVEHRIAELEDQGAESERENYEHETRTRQKYLSEVSSDHATNLGEIKQLEEQKKQLIKKLGTEYAEIEQNYNAAKNELQCTLEATDDLHKYQQALDAAIMQYHSIKMEEINQVLDELWKDTYMGSDIDTIMIKSEAENRTARGSYHYRVVMVKQGVQLDMRGRCSAGQKLLACVLIRLALSECFGVNSGFLVLDEPTTNLDVSNIESLARSLGRIISTRHTQSNFQLIVITHDEHFLSCLGASNYCDTFFRIKRDSHQHSRIEELPIGNLH